MDFGVTFFGASICFAWFRVLNLILIKIMFLCKLSENQKHNLHLRRLPKSVLQFYHRPPQRIVKGNSIADRFESATWVYVCVWLCGKIHNNFLLTNPEVNRNKKCHIITTTTKKIQMRSASNRNQTENHISSGFFLSAQQEIIIITIVYDEGGMWFVCKIHLPSARRCNRYCEI